MQVIYQPQNIQTNDEQWWFIYNDSTKNVLQLPLKCLGKTSSPHVMVIADTEQECENYIIQNNLIKN